MADDTTRDEANKETAEAVDQATVEDAEAGPDAALAEQGGGAGATGNPLAKAANSVQTEAKVMDIAGKAIG